MSIDKLFNATLLKYQCERLFALNSLFDRYFLIFHYYFTDPDSFVITLISYLNLFENKKGI